MSFTQETLRTLLAYIIHMREVDAWHDIFTAFFILYLSIHFMLCYDKSNICNLLFLFYPGEGAF